MNDIIRREDFGEAVVLQITTTAIDAIAAAAIAAECQPFQPITVLDFHEVDFINSDGMSALLRLTVAARADGAKLFALNLPPHHRRMFKHAEIERFLPLIEIHDLDRYRTA